MEDIHGRVRLGRQKQTEGRISIDLQTMGADLAVIRQFLAVVKKYLPAGSGRRAELEGFERHFEQLAREMTEELYTERCVQETAELTSTSVNPRNINEIQTFLDNLYIFSMERRVASDAEQKVKSAAAASGASVP